MNMQALIAFDKPLTCVGNLLLQSLRDQIVVLSLSPNPDWNNVRKLIGEYLFTMQMFYSNTNWVETYGNVTCNELGELSQQSTSEKIYCLMNCSLRHNIWNRWFHDCYDSLIELVFYVVAYFCLKSFMIMQF